MLRYGHTVFSVGINPLKIMSKGDWLVVFYLNMLKRGLRHSRK